MCLDLRLLDRYGFCEVARLVYIASAADCDVIGQQLQRDNFNERHQQFWGGGNCDDVLDEAANCRVPFGCDGDDSAAARRYFLDIRESFLIAQL